MITQTPKLFMKVGNQDEFEVSERIHGLRFLGENSSPQFTNNYQDVTNLDGSPFAFETFAKTTINAQFWLHFRDYTDYKLLKHEIYRIFGARQLIRIRTDTDPAKVYFVYPTPFDIAPTKPEASDALFTIPFENPSGYRYSLYRSDTPYTFSQNGWQLGMNLKTDRAPTYHFTSLKFDVYNASDIKIDPYYQRHDLKIICKFKGSSLKLTNKTNNSVWSYNKSSDGNHTVILDGVNSYLDGTNCNGDTDYGNILLEPGYNSIEATGATSVDITFSFPFIYLS
ncbi:phage tail domain-containing protein [Paucilactobacillus sp. N302-9]